jgi:hypothetical protein
MLDKILRVVGNSNIPVKLLKLVFQPFYKYMQ